MMTHTQGPWAVSNYYAGKASISGENWGGFATVVTKLDGDESEYGEGLANARLIVAAPDLLAALENIVSASSANDGDSLMNAIREGIAAISKAREAA